MKKVSLAILAVTIFGVAAHAQNRVFDNFDRTQGVSVYREPLAEPPASIPRRTKRGKYEVVVKDNLVKKTAQTAAVTDGFASRDAITRGPATRFAMGSSINLKGFTTGNPVHDSYIVESSRRYNIDPLLIYSQMHQESSFKLKATSHKGASGLMQLMPATARRFGVTSIYDPKQNIDAGVKYMRWLLDTFNQDVVLALAGYNAGEGAVMKYGWRVPPYRETQEYVRRITGRYNMISDGRYVQSAPRGTATAKLVQKESKPLTVLEVSPVAMRTPDGKMMLINQ
jgi:soluble lytic murein transglycosylase-like protein